MQFIMSMLIESGALPQEVVTPLQVKRPTRRSGSGTARPQARLGTARPGTARHGLGHGSAWLGMAGHSSARPGTAGHGWAWLGTAGHRWAWLDMAGMARHGRARLGWA
jgi:hypothetical protein